MRIELENFMRYIQRNNIKDAKAKGLIRMGRLFLCRALSESKPKAKLELSANQSGTLNESKPKAQHEFSERDK